MVALLPSEQFLETVTSEKFEKFESTILLAQFMQLVVPLPEKVPKAVLGIKSYGEAAPSPQWETAVGGDDRFSTFFSGAGKVREILYCSSLFWNLGALVTIVNKEHKLAR